MCAVCRVSVLCVGGRIRINFKVNGPYIFLLYLNVFMVVIFTHVHFNKKGLQ